jgi:hypothetical protein
MNTNLNEFVRVDETAACDAYEAEMAANEASLTSSDTIPCPPPSECLEEDTIASLLQLRN